MLDKIVGIFKAPIDTLVEYSQREDTKVAAIKLAISSVAIIVVSLIFKVINIYQTITEDTVSLFGKASAERVAEKRAEAIENLEIFSSLIKGILILAVAMAVVALVMWIITKLCKSEKKYSSMLSIVVNTAIIYLALNIVAQIVSIAYLPAGLLLSFAIITFLSFAFIGAFVKVSEVEDVNKMVLISTGVLAVVVVILVFVVSAMTGVSIDDLLAVKSTVDSLSYYNYF